MSVQVELMLSIKRSNQKHLLCLSFSTIITKTTNKNIYEQDVKPLFNRDLFGIKKTKEREEKRILLKRNCEMKSNKQSDSLQAVTKTKIKK